MSWVITGTQKNKGLLDEFTGAAAAYSLRDLTFLRGNPVVRVRRSSDSTEADFTATEVSDGTLAAWVGAGNNGFVRTWYDQSGNGRDATQTTTASQPQIVSNGSVLLKNLLPVVKFDSNDLLSATVSRTDTSIFLVGAANTVNSNFCIILGGNNGSGIGARPTLRLYDSMSVFNANASDNTVVLGETLLASSINHSGLSNLYKNSILVSSAAGAAVSRTALVLGKENVTAFTPSQSEIQEVVVYTANQSTNRAAIEAKINAHYAIY